MGSYPLVVGETAIVGMSGAGNFLSYNGADIALPDVTIKNCGAFFVHFLSPVPMTRFSDYPNASHPCAYRYCTSDVAPVGFAPTTYAVPAPPSPSITVSVTRTKSTTASGSRTSSASVSPLTQSATPSAPPPGVTWITVDGAAESGFVDAGASVYYVYAQPLPYAVLLTLNSLIGDADLFVGPAAPALNGSFAVVASSTNGDQRVDAVGCLPAGHAWSASGDTCSSCFGPTATTAWFVRVTGWSTASFSLNVTSMLDDPLFVGSPQPSPGVLGAQLALGVTAAGRLDVAATSAYWELGVPIEAAEFDTYVYLHRTG